MHNSNESMAWTTSYLAVYQCFSECEELRAWISFPEWLARLRLFGRVFDNLLLTTIRFQSSEDCRLAADGFQTAPASEFSRRQRFDETVKPVTKALYQQAFRGPVRTASGTN